MTMTVRQLIEKLNALVADPANGVTMETPVFEDSLGVSEGIASVHWHERNRCVYVSTISDEEMAEIDRRAAERS